MNVKGQPEEIKFLFWNLIEKKSLGDKVVFYPELSNERLDWLDANGFKYRYNDNIYEWEIEL